MAESPRNIRIVINGTRYPCDVLRDPDADANGCAAWLVVPRVPLPPVNTRRDTFKLSADYMPAMILLHVRLPLPGETQ